MLNIRTEQVDALNSQLWEASLNRVVAFISAEFPEETQELGELENTLQCEQAMQVAMTYNLNTESDILSYVYATFLFGVDFEHTPDHQWAQGMLQKYAATSCTPGAFWDAITKFQEDNE